MNTNDYNYELPEQLIAQTPLKERSASKLLVMDRKTGQLEDSVFKNIKDYLKKGDCLVINNTKVIPARLIGIKEETNAHIELLLLKNTEGNIWECLAKPAKRLHINTKINFGNLLMAIVTNKKDDGIVEVEFSYEGIFMEVLEKLGTMPLPPYIHEKLKDQSRYQTVYAIISGSSAAPTAGLHFTKELLKELKDIGINILEITLHVGLGTFRPVEVTDITKHKMHSEYYEMNEETAKELNKAKEENRRIISVGTTTTRTLETIIHKYNKFVPCSGNTDIFIYPGFEFKAIDALITNFHLPKSTLLMLVSAFSRREYVLKAYEHAINNNYRFFSFGDAMFIK